MAGVVHGTQDAIATNFSGRIAFPRACFFGCCFFCFLFVVGFVFVFVFVCLFFVWFLFPLGVCVLLTRPRNAHWIMYRSAIALFCGRLP